MSRRLGALLLAGAWGFAEGHVVAPSWALFLVMSCGGVAMLVAAREGERAGASLARAAGIMGLCAAVAIAMPPLLSRLHVIPGAAAVAATLLRFAGRGAAVGEDGMLLLPGHAGATAVALTWEMAALPVLLRAAAALAVLGGFGPAGIAVRVGAWGGFRLLMMAAARGEGFEESWMREPLLTLLTTLPLALPGIGTGRPTWDAKGPRGPFAGGVLRPSPSPLLFVLMGLIGGACVGWWWSFHDPGEKGKGRILIDESHSDWEPTDGPFDATRHGQRSLYNYALWRRWIEMHFPTRVARTPIGEQDLGAADVLVIKTPTRPYDTASIDLIERFVQAGGGLLLIGDHTNLFGMSTVLNPIAGRFGLSFAYDDTFPLDHTHPDVHRPSAWVRHPILRGIASYPFETSCTLSVPWRGVPFIIGRRLGAEPADYGHMNFFGNIRLEPDEAFGLFVQAAVVEHGRGRAAAFSDSTNFSNFSMLGDGRRELTLNMIDWLDRRRAPPRRALAAVPLVAGSVLLLLATRAALASAPGFAATGLWAALIGFAVAGSAASRVGIALAGEVRPIAPIHRVAFDRSLSAFEPAAVPAILDLTEPSLETYESLFIDTARAGVWPEVTDDIAAASQEASVIAIINPDRSPLDAEREALSRFLHRGGKLLVIDSVLNRRSAAGLLLGSLGIETRTVIASSTDPAAGAPGPMIPRLDVAAGDGWNRVQLATGVTAFSKELEAGRVVLAIDGALFSDAAYGGVYVNPDAGQIERRDAQTALLRLVMDGA